MPWRDERQPRPMPIASPREPERFTADEATGDAARDGYTTIARRPRVRSHEIHDLDRADRIEGYVSDFDMDDY